MVDVEPSNYDVLLVGPRVGRLEPFFGQWGYRVVACHEGTAGIRALKHKPYHLVVFELELDDLESHEFMAEATALQPISSFMLLEDPSKTGMIVSTFVQGADCYVPTPPDEHKLYEMVGRQVLASAARGGGAGDEVAQANAEVEQARTALREAGGKVRALTAENKELQQTIAELEKARDDLKKENAKLTTEAKAAAGTGTAMLSLEGMPVSQEDLEEMASKADFVQFLESENDEIKQEMKRLKARLRELGEDIPDDDDENTGEGDAIVSIEGEDGGEDEELIAFADVTGAADALVALDLEESMDDEPIEEEQGEEQAAIAAVFDDADLFFDEDDDEPPTSTIKSPAAMVTDSGDDGQATALLSRDPALDSLAGRQEAGFGEDAAAASDDEEGTLAGDGLNASDLQSSSEEGLNAEEEAELAALLAETAAAEEEADDAFTGEMAPTREMSMMGAEAPLDPAALLRQAQADARAKAEEEATHAVPGIGSSSSESGAPTLQTPRARRQQTLLHSDAPPALARGPSPHQDFSGEDPTTSTPLTPALGKKRGVQPSVKLDALPGQEDATRLLDDDAVSMLRNQLGDVSLSDSLSVDVPDAVKQQLDAAVVEEPMPDDEATAIGAEVPPELLAKYAAEDRVARAAAEEPVEATYAGGARPAPEMSIEDEMSALEEVLLSGLGEEDEATRVGAEIPKPPAAARPKVPSEMDAHEATSMNSLASLSAEELFGGDGSVDDGAGVFRDMAGGSAPPPEGDDFDDPTVAIAGMQVAAAEPGTQIVEGIAPSSRPATRGKQSMAIEIDDEF